MNFKILFICLLMFNFSYASFQELKIGEIDAYYQDKITREELRDIIGEIEELFESQLQMNIFDYSSSGKPIDILYLPASKLEERINKKIEKLNIKKMKIDKLKKKFKSNEKNIDILKANAQKENLALNKQIDSYNIYINKLNEEKIKTKQRYNQIKTESKKRKIELDKAISSFKQEQQHFKHAILKHNNKSHTYNERVREFYRLKKEIEILSKNFKKTKGVTIAAKKITLKTYYKNGLKVKEKSVEDIMNKIEIYGFESIQELKVILAHEIGHLVGIPHIQIKGALMHPIIQDRQIEKLFLTDADIEIFKDNFSE